MNERDYTYLERIFLSIGSLIFILILFGFLFKAFEITVGSIMFTLSLMFLTFLGAAYFRFKKLLLILEMEKEIKRHRDDFNVKT
jgi:uncharacterized membrane protein